MKVDFFTQACRKMIKDIRFGICDDNNKNPAYTKTTNEDTWNASVINQDAKEITFTAIDNCVIILRENLEMECRCDVMLHYENNLFFVELKDKRQNWKSEGINQIEATIKRMIEENGDFYFSFRKRKAIVANSKHRFPCFETYDTEQRNIFWTKYRIRIQFKSEIVIT